MDDPTARSRERRRRARRRRRLRRAALVLLVLAAGAAGMVTAQLGGGEEAEAVAVPEQTTPAAPEPTPDPLAPRPPPAEMRGVHVSLGTASLPGKLEEILSLPGLNTVELDVKDENGHVGFLADVPLARAIGAARPYYDARQAALAARRHGVYLIGRVVCFEDPLLSAGRPGLAVQNPDGSPWRNSAGLGWADPYSRKVWKYLVDVATAAAEAGFDEIQFDYVRFPSDGDTSRAVYPSRTSTPPGWTIAEFVHYASKRLKRRGVRVSADVFGLAANRDLGIGQIPRRLARHLDAVYPMVYPSHYRPGEYGLPDPNAAPRETVASSLADFRRELGARRTTVIPWLQDFSLGRTYGPGDVQAQIDAALAAGAPGFLLWNAEGEYTTEALTYGRE